MDYCLRVERGETIVIGSELEARPLVEAASKAVILRGAHPLVRLEIPGLHEFFLEHADDAQLAHLPPSAIAEAEAVDARIRISAESDTRSMSRVDPRRQAAYERARDPIRRAARQKRWVLTQYPTAAYAADAGMTLADYEAFVQAALFLDRADPRRGLAGAGPSPGGTGGVHVAGPIDPDRGRRHRPDPLRRRSHLDQLGRPAQHALGRDLHRADRGLGLRPAALRFPRLPRWPQAGRDRPGVPQGRGRRRASATTAKITCWPCSSSTPAPAARRARAGAQPGIDRFTGSILFDEKIGGTVHLALGQSYPETGGVNVSALHWDLIVDTRTRGRIRADDRLVMENGRWLVG